VLGIIVDFYNLFLGHSISAYYYFTAVYYYQVSNSYMLINVLFLIVNVMPEWTNLWCLVQCFGVWFITAIYCVTKLRNSFFLNVVSIVRCWYDISGIFRLGFLQSMSKLWEGGRTFIITFRKTLHFFIYFNCMCGKHIGGFKILKQISSCDYHRTYFNSILSGS